MKRVLILTASYGEGHNSAARALKAAFDEIPGTGAELLDLYALHTPRLNELSRRGYLRLINSAPRLWSGVYRWLDRSPRAPAVIRMMPGHRALLHRLLADRRPAAIVSTFPAYAWLLNRLREEGRTICPHFSVVTDALTINALWYGTPSAGWFVTDDDSAAFLRARGLPSSQVHVSGFPVALPFADRPSAWQPTTFGAAAPRRVLFMVNTCRGAALAIARALLQLRGTHVTITAGRDAALRDELAHLARGQPASSEVLGWTDRVPELLMTHHVVISKAGGATTQEAINALCPMLISQVVPGQEEGNAELLRRHHAGALATTPDAIVATLARAFADEGALWRHWRDNLRRLARPDAARTIARQVLASCATRPAPLEPCG